MSRVMVFLSFSPMPFEGYVISNFKDLRCCCGFEFGAASQMYCIFISKLSFHFNEIFGDWFDLTRKNIKVINLFTTKLCFHQIHVVSISCAVGDSIDFNPGWRENWEMLNLNLTSWKPCSNIGGRLCSEHIFKICQEFIGIGGFWNFCNVILFFLSITVIVMLWYFFFEFTLD